jgi:branched-chain amino acid aminotransferase
MVALANERVAYFNGKIVPESDVLIPFRDRGFHGRRRGVRPARTVNHRIFKLKEHIDRLYNSLRYIKSIRGSRRRDDRHHGRCGGAQPPDRRRRRLLGEPADLARLRLRGLRRRPRDDADGHRGCRPLPLKQRARLFRDGIDVIVPAIRRTAPDMLSPRAKTHNYLNLVMGDLEAKAADPEAWAVLLDANGNLCEGTGSNIFIVRSGTVMTPRERYVLPGISRETVIELAREIGQPCVEADIDLYDAYTADEAFLTSTSLCICPVRSVNGRHVGVDTMPGPVTQRLIDAFAKLLDFDYVAQYKRRLNG